MIDYKESFARMEKKYILDRNTMSLFLNAAGKRIDEDDYPYSVINSIYFDSFDNNLISRSMDKPNYKDKIRIRTYSGTVKEDTPAFAEIKRKIDGKVYKRRIDGSYRELFHWLMTYGSLGDSSQISKEIAYLRDYYGAFIPSMQIGYRRESFVDACDSSLRITFDTDIIWRNWDLTESADAYGLRLLEESTVLMEVKVSGSAVPLWLCRLIGEFGIRTSSISKYGLAYINSLGKNNCGIITMNNMKERYIQYA